MFSQLVNPANYYFNPYAIPTITVSMLIFFIGIFVLRQNRSYIVNIAFFYKCFAMSFWLFTISFVYLSRTSNVAILWYRYFTFFGVVNIMPSVMLFAIAWSGELRSKKNFVITNYIISFVFYGLAVYTDKLISPYAMRKYFWGYYPIYSMWVVPYLVFFVTQFIISIGGLYSAYKSEEIPIKRIQKRIVVIALLIAVTASTDFLPKFFNIAMYPYGYVSMFIYISLVAYSIVKYRAFDIETVIHKTIIWSLTFSFMIIPVLLLHKWVFPYIRGSDVLQIGFWTISFLIVAFYLRAIQPKIDHLFQRRRSNLEEISRHFTGELVHLKGLNQLAQRMENTIADTLYPQHVELFIYNETKENFRLTSAIDDATEIVELKNDDQFLVWLAKNNKIAYREFVEIDPAYSTIREIAKNYFNVTKAIVVIPLVLNEKLLGVINLGKKANLKRYDAADFNFLTTLKNQSTIAISNSLLYENIENQVRQRTGEIIKLQTQLIQAEKLATMGTLAGGVAHEINNPLTAILTNVQMLQATGDTLDSDTKESLELIEEATKRCRTIVQKLMAYARKPLETSALSRINLQEVIENTISFLDYQLEQENIKISLERVLKQGEGKKEADFWVRGNQNELEQVITNIILNAKDAIKQIKKKRGNIRLSLFENSDDWLHMDIQDDGIGMPQEILSKIFDPFFTTKDVGKGMGLGLSICQAIIERHNGLITVQSEPGKGSIFTLKLPRARMRSGVEAKV